MPETVQAEKRERSWISVVGEYVAIFAVAYLLAFVMQNFLFGSFEIKQHSMEPTLYELDRVFINRITYKVGSPKRGDIVILVDPMGSNDDFVKRVVALPGEIISLKNGETYINFKKLDEPYVNGDQSADNLGPLRVPDGEYFVMGDNRPVSMDSRRFGPIPKEDILGKVVVLWWPPAHTRVF